MGVAVKNGQTCRMITMKVSFLSSGSLFLHSCPFKGSHHHDSPSFDRRPNITAFVPSFSSACVSINILTHSYTCRLRQKHLLRREERSKTGKGIACVDRFLPLSIRIRSFLSFLSSITNSKTLSFLLSLIAFQGDLSPLAFQLMCLTSRFSFLLFSPRPLARFHCLCAFVFFIFA